MPRRKKNADKSANNEAVEAALAEAQTNVPAGPIDHSSQFGSWNSGSIDPSVETEAIAELEAQPEASEQPAEEFVTEFDNMPSEPEAPADEGGTEEAPAEEVSEAQAPQSFAELLAAVSEDDVDGMVLKVAGALDERAEFELAKKGEGHNIQRTLKKARSEVVTKRAARVMCATNVDPAIFNRSIHEGARYNVYAIGKFADIVKALGSDDPNATVSNAINRAVMKSLYHFKAAGETFNGDMARAACSAQIRVTDTKLKAHLVRHTVAPSTAPTQASSTMQALQTLGVVRAEGSTRNPNYFVIDGPLSQRVEEILAAA